MWDLCSRFITCYFISHLSNWDSKLQTGITETAYFFEGEKLAKTLKKAQAFKIRSTKEKLTSKGSRVGVGICKVAVLAFQFGISQSMFTNVSLSWNKQVVGYLGGSLTAARICLGGHVAHGEKG